MFITELYISIMSVLKLTGSIDWTWIQILAPEIPWILFYVFLIICCLIVSD